MALKKTGMELAKIRLQRTIGVGLPNTMDSQVHAAAKEMQQRARDMAPIDYGDLKDAIRIKRHGQQGTGGRFVKGLGIYVVWIDRSRPVRDPEKLEQGFTTVGDYAWRVHEHMGWGNRPGAIKPSQKSIDAGRRAGVEAGGKFMDRAFLDVAIDDGGILARLVEANRNYLRRLDK